MQNIDPLYLLTPVIIIAFSFGLVIYWHFRRRLTAWILGLSAIAYFGAIIIKYLIQIPTIGPLEIATEGNHVVLGIYYGLQTVFFEVGGAYLVVRMAAKRANLKASDAEGFGLGLALWENGVYIGILTLINLVSYFFILSLGPNSSIAQLVYNSLAESSPGLFLGPSQALPNIGLGILERVSSLLAHFSWGYLIVLSVVHRRRLFFVIALPMGFVDFLVPFSEAIGVTLFEVIIFLISVLFLIMALSVGRNSHMQLEGEPNRPSPIEIASPLVR